MDALSTRAETEKVPGEPMLFAELTSELNVPNILMYLLGGLALFLFGMDQLADALKLIAGNSMKTALARLTTNRVTAAISGAFVTAVIQSSSVTTVLTVGFITAGLMTLQQSIGIILGANIGTTVTAQIIAFKITQYALVMIFVGFAMHFMSSRQKIVQYGNMIMGLGLVFFGMQLMSDGTKPLRDYEPFIDMMMQMSNPFWAILAAAAFTGIVQSSSATTGIVIVLASQGFISLEVGIALIFGANIGTCVTAMLASIGKPREAIRAAVVHVLFNVLGVAIWIAFIPNLSEFIVTVSPASPELEGTARLAAETPRQIANAHTVFNVANTILFIGFTGPMAWIVKKLVPDRVTPEAAAARPKHLVKILLSTPVLALDTVRLELGRLGNRAALMVRHSLDATTKGSEKELAELEAMDNDIDGLHGAIVTYLGKLSQENLNKNQSDLMYDYLAAANQFEAIGDIIETNLTDAGRKRLAADVVVSPETQIYLEKLHGRVSWAVESCVTALVHNDAELANQIIATKPEISELADTTGAQLSRRLGVQEPNRLHAFRLESEITEYLKRIYYFAKRVAKIVVGTDVKPTKASEETID